MKQYIGGKYRKVYKDKMGHYVIEIHNKKKSRIPVHRAFKGKHGWRYKWR